MNTHDADINYIDTYQRELSPAWLNYVAALHGCEPPRIDRAFSYLELGCGFGTSSVVHAACFPDAELHACDQRPAQIAAARQRAEALGVDNLRLHCVPLQCLDPDELPDCDFIVLHGVYSWVSAAIRAAVRALISRKLKRAGLVYVSYNCLPGWAVEAPLRKLLLELSAAVGGDVAQRSRHALQSLTALRSAQLRYFRDHSAATHAVQDYWDAPSEYLAHEFLSDTWEPFYSIDVADELAECGLRYVGSATLADNHPLLTIDERAARAVACLPSRREQNLALDFATNRRFRRDVFVRADAPAQTPRALAQQPFGQVGDASSIQRGVPIPRGQLHLQPAFLAELTQLLEAGPTTIGAAVSALAGGSRDSRAIVRNVTLLMAAGALAPFARVARKVGSHDASPGLQRALRFALEHGSGCIVPSEVLGHGIRIPAAQVGELHAWLASPSNDPRTLASLLSRLRLAGLIDRAVSPHRPPEK